MYVYLHGLNSAGHSAKAGWLRSALAPARVLAPTFPVHNLAEALPYLSGYIFAACDLRATGEQMVLIGSSLGGFYARHLAGLCKTALGKR